MYTNGDLRQVTEGISAQSEIYLASKWVMVSTLSRFSYQGKLEIGQLTQMGGRTEDHLITVDFTDTIIHLL